MTPPGRLDPAVGRLLHSFGGSKPVQADRWQRVKDIFGAVLERPAQEREAFLQQACIGDGDLRRDVDSLLTARAEAGAFLSGPANLGEMDRPPSLTPDSSEEITP